MRINHSIGGVKSSNADLPGGISIFLCTPALDGQCSIEYAASLAETAAVFSKLNIPIIINRSNNSCFVDLSRNLFVSLFMESECTHLLQIDSDMSWKPESIIRMLKKDREFIGAVGRKKLENEEYAGINFTDHLGNVMGQTGEREEDVLIEMQYMGGAFTLQKRSVFEKLDEKYPEYRTEGTGKNGHYFYHCQYNEKAWHTEDYVFCHLCRNAGVQIWAYADVTLGHRGTKNYEGNFFNYLKALPPAPKVKLYNGMIEVPA